MFKNNGELPKYLISNNHTPIVSRETFKLVQTEKARRNSKRKNRVKLQQNWAVIIQNMLCLMC